MKILCIGKYLSEGNLAGPERFAFELYEKLKIRTIDISFLAFFLGNSSVFSKLFGRKVIKAEDNVFQLGLFTVLIRIVNEQPDLIHLVTQERINIFIYYFAKFVGIPVVSSYHGLISFESEKQKIKGFEKFKNLLLEKVSLRYSKKICVPSVLMKDLIKNEYHIEEKKFEIIPHGVSCGLRFESRKFDDSERLKLLFYDGAIKEFSRGFNELFTVLDKSLNMEISVVGSDREIEVTEEQLTVKYMPFIEREALLDLMKSVDVIIKSTQLESFSLMVLECMSLGVVPVISSNIGISEHIKSGVNGFVYSKDKPDQINKILWKLYKNREILTTLSIEAVRTAENLSWNKAADSYISLYGEIVR